MWLHTKANGLPSPRTVSSTDRLVDVGAVSKTGDVSGQASPRARAPLSDPQSPGHEADETAPSEREVHEHEVSAETLHLPDVALHSAMSLDCLEEEPKPRVQTRVIRKSAVGDGSGNSVLVKNELRDADGNHSGLRTASAWT